VIRAAWGLLLLLTIAACSLKSGNPAAPVAGAPPTASPAPGASASASAAATTSPTASAAASSTATPSPSPTPAAATCTAPPNQTTSTSAGSINLPSCAGYGGTIAYGASSDSSITSYAGPTFNFSVSNSASLIGLPNTPTNGLFYVKIVNNPSASGTDVFTAASASSTFTLPSSPAGATYTVVIYEGSTQLSSVNEGPASNGTVTYTGPFSSSSVPDNTTYYIELEQS